MKHSDRLRMSKTEYRVSLALAKFIVIILAIFAYSVRVLVKLLFKLKRWLFRMAIVVFVLYGAFSAVTMVTYAPRAEAKPLTPEQLSVKSIVLSVARYEFGEDQVKYVDYIVTHESGWRTNAINSSSGACGLFQSLPCSKMGTMSLQDQIHFGINYLRNRYGTPSNAWAFWQRNNWY